MQTENKTAMVRIAPQTHRILEKLKDQTGLNYRQLVHQALLLLDKDGKVVYKLEKLDELS